MHWPGCENSRTRRSGSVFRDRSLSRPRTAERHPLLRCAGSCRGPSPARAPARSGAASALRWVTTRRRSTLLMLRGGILVVAALVVNLIVVKRAQTDPLQSGAVQVARLQPCLIVFSEAEMLDPNSQSFSGSSIRAAAPATARRSRSSPPHSKSCSASFAMRSPGPTPCNWCRTPRTTRSSSSPTDDRAGDRTAADCPSDGPGGEKMSFVAHDEIDELHVLRRRAYGPNPDIGDDPRALSRLRELEARLRPEAPAIAEDVSMGSRDLHLDETDAKPPADEDKEPLRRAILRPALVSAARGLQSLRRSTVLIALGSALIVGVLVTALVLVQRAQPYPLLAGTTEVATLEPDRDFVIPAVFGYLAQDGRTAQGFQKFRGLRVVVGDNFFGRSDTSQCLSVYADANITNPNSNSFEGNMYSGCSAGDFPAAVAVEVDYERLPNSFDEPPQDPDGLQFVYDSEHHVVVVFRD